VLPSGGETGSPRHLDQVIFIKPSRQMTDIRTIPKATSCAANYPASA
jgi:hypothetical protein